MSPDDTNAIILPDPLSANNAYQRVVAFARHFGEPHTILAMHAALPLGLTPEIVHLIRINFVRDADWIAEADLLLSLLCREVGGDLYEMYPDVREFLLDELRFDQEFGPSRVRLIAEFLLAYAERAIKLTKSPEMLDFLRAQQWVALAYARPKDAAQSLALALREGLESANRDETIRIANLTQVLATPLIAEEKVLLYAAGVEKLAAGDRAAASRLLEAVGPTDESPRIGDVSLPSPSELMQVLGGSFPTHQAPAPLVLYPNLNCPSQIIINQKFNLSVQLLSERSGEGIEAIHIKDTGVDEQLPEVEVVLRVSSFEVEDSNVKLLRVQRDNVSQEEFVLIPHQLNDQLIQVEFYQYSQLIGTANCYVSVVAESGEQVTKGLQDTDTGFFQRPKIERSLESERIHGALFRLNYVQQVRLFREFIEEKRIGAFLVHGSPEHGQIFLLKRLLLAIPDSTVTLLIQFYLSRRVLRKPVAALWRELGRQMGVQNFSSHEEIATNVVFQLQTQHIILVFHDLDCVDEDYLHELIRDFWVPLATTATATTLQASNFMLLMFLVDHEGCVGGWNFLFADQLDPIWEPGIVVKLPVINRFSERELANWLENAIDALPTKVTKNIDYIVQIILEKTEGVPERVFSEIFELCGSNWQEEEVRWLKL